VPFSPEQTNQVIAAINKVVGSVLTCWSCQHDAWTLADGIISQQLLNFSDPLGSIRLSGPALPVVALTCTTCGNTAYFNVFVLGLQDMLPNSGRGA